jgi:hypothetical protein
MTQMETLDRQDLELALGALIPLVRQEYPDRPLAEIAATWGEGATPQAVEALARVDSMVAGSAAT